MRTAHLEPIIARCDNESIESIIGEIRDDADDIGWKAREFDFYGKDLMQRGHNDTRVCYAKRIAGELYLDVDNELDAAYCFDKAGKHAYFQGKRSPEMHWTDLSLDLRKRAAELFKKLDEKEEAGYQHLFIAITYKERGNIVLYEQYLVSGNKLFLDIGRMPQSTDCKRELKAYRQRELISAQESG